MVSQHSEFDWDTYVIFVLVWLMWTVGHHMCIYMLQCVYPRDKAHIPRENISHRHFNLHSHLTLKTKALTVYHICPSFGWDQCFSCLLGHCGFHNEQFLLFLGAISKVNVKACVQVQALVTQQQAVVVLWCWPTFPPCFFLLSKSSLSVSCKPELVTNIGV